MRESEPFVNCLTPMLKHLPFSFIIEIVQRKTKEIVTKYGLDADKILPGGERK